MNRIQIILIAITLSLSISGFAQKAKNPYEAIDRAMLAIPASQTNTTQDIASYVSSHFKTDSDKLRAIFAWTATSIEYDIDKMFLIRFDETEQEKINRAMATHRGVCANYAAIFNDICVKAGLHCYVISGYTKYNGYASYLSHAWCAAAIGNQWYIFDPTWGSGYLSGGKFVKQLDNKYYKVPPAQIIKSHMPFDPMWQFLNYTVSNQEFFDGKTALDRTKPYFSYTDSINAYMQMDSISQLQATARRIEANGVKTSLVYDRLGHVKSLIEYKKKVNENAQYNQNSDTYNSATADYNDCVNAFNDFIKYRNEQFKPSKPDTEIQAMIDLASEKLKSAKTKLKSINNPTGNIGSLKATLWKYLDDLSDRVDEQREFLRSYFPKSKLGRKTMFRKYTWFGVPLN